MKLLTKTLEKRFAQVGRQDQVYDPLVIAKFFNPSKPTEEGAYYAIAYYPQERLFFGYYACTFRNRGDCWEYFSPGKMPSDSFERDQEFQEQPASQAIYPEFPGWWDLEIMLSC